MPYDVTIPVVLAVVACSTLTSPFAVGYQPRAAGPVAGLHDLMVGGKEEVAQEQFERARTV